MIEQGIAEVGKIFIMPMIIIQCLIAEHFMSKSIQKSNDDQEK